MIISELLTLVTLFSAYGWAGATPPTEAQVKFDQILVTHPEQIWAPNAPPRLRAAIKAYADRRKVKGGLIYGDSVRTYSLKGKCADEIAADMKTLGCQKKTDVIREPLRNQPVRGADGRTTPIWQFVCADGGVIKVKPLGDPNSRYTSFPHASRTLRFPAESKYRDYRDEVAKISEDGHVIPRGPGDLKPRDLVEGWSREAHIPLTSCAAKSP